MFRVSDAVGVLNLEESRQDRIREYLEEDAFFNWKVDTVVTAFNLNDIETVFRTFEDIMIGSGKSFESNKKLNLSNIV